MLVGRFKVQSRPEWTHRVEEAMAACEAPSRELRGVVHFDITRSLSAPDTFLATEVFADREAFDAQNAQAEVAALLALIDQGASVDGYEWTLWETTDS